MGYYEYLKSKVDENNQEKQKEFEKNLKALKEEEERANENFNNIMSKVGERMRARKEEELKEKINELNEKTKEEQEKLFRKNNNIPDNKESLKALLKGTLDENKRLSKFDNNINYGD